jgi:hypothetical protein
MPGFIASHLTRAGGDILRVPAADGAIGDMMATDGDGVLQLASSGAVNVKLFGAVGDGETDDRAAIQAGLDAIESSGGGVLFFPAGEYLVTGSQTLDVPSGVSVVGHGIDTTTVLIEDARATNSVFECDGVSRCRFNDFSIIRESEGILTPGQLGFGGINIVGGSSDIIVERVRVRGAGSGIITDGTSGTDPDTIRRVTIRDCDCSYNSAFGIRVLNTEAVTLDNCWCHFNHLDGAKLNGMAFDVLIQGGLYEDNGPTVSGDGIDCFAGGDRFRIIGGTFRRNSTQGITIKTDGLTVTDPEIYGYVRRVQVIGTHCYDNGGSGIGFYAHAPEDSDRPLAAHATIMGNLCESSDLRGIWIDARNVTVSGNICRLNGQEGIRVGAKSLDVSLSDNQIIANSQDGAGDYDGILIEGRRISVRGGNIIGVDADEIMVEGDYAALTKYHRNSIRVASAARDVLIDGVMESYSVQTLGINSQQTTATDGCVIRQRGTVAPYSSGVYGGVGSQYVRISSFGPAALWRKVTGTPNQSMTGWVREFATVLANQTIGITETTVAHGLGYTPTEISIVPRADARVWRSNAPDATNLYLTASASVSCDITVR